MRESDIRILVSVGLNRTEAVIYLDLIRHPFSTPSDIAGRCNIHRPNVYDSVKKLKERGLIVENINVKGKKYSALDPDKLKLYLKQKESELDELIEDLKKIPKILREDKKIEVLEGVSIRKEIIDLIESRKKAFVFLNPDFDFSNLKFLRKLNEKRIKKKIPIKVIVSKNSKSKFSKFRKLPYTYIKEADFEIPQLITIVIENAFYYLLKDSTLIKINNKNIALERKIFFDYVWKRAKPLK